MFDVHVCDTLDSMRYGVQKAYNRENYHIKSRPAKLCIYEILNSLNENFNHTQMHTHKHTRAHTHELWSNVAIRVSLLTLSLFHSYVMYYAYT